MFYLYVTLGGLAVLGAFGWYISRQSKKSERLKGDAAEAKVLARDRMLTLYEWEESQVKAKEKERREAGLSPAERLNRAGKIILVCLLLGGCTLARGLRLDRDIPMPKRPQWCSYKAYDRGKGVWLSDADSDTLTRNINDLKLFCDQLEASIRIHNEGR